MNPNAKPRTKKWLLLLIPIIAMTACSGGGSVTPPAEPTVTPPSLPSSSPANTAPPANVSTPDQPRLTYDLPAPNTDGTVSVEKTLAGRRSQRQYSDEPITLEQLSQILWAAYGISYPAPATPNTAAPNTASLRTAPSAGALYPLEIYAVAGNVVGIEPGVYRYIAEEHKIEMTVEGDVRRQLCDAALGQAMVRQAPALLVYSGVFERTAARYGERANRYVYIELGHSAQNVYLQTEALGLGTCAIGAFADEDVRRILNLPADEQPLYIMPIGYY